MLWLPVIGPIINGIVTIFTKKQDNALETLKTTTSADVEDAKTIYSFLEVMKDDQSLKAIRNIILIGPAIWIFLLSYDTILAKSYFKDYMWGVASFEDTGAPYIPYAVMVYVLGNVGINAWKRR